MSHRLNVLLFVSIIAHLCILCCQSSFISKSILSKEDVELKELLSELRRRLAKNNNKVSIVRSVHDNVNEERWRDVFDTDSQGRVILSSRADSSFTDQQQIQLVASINDQRAAVGASDMYKIHWHPKLAKLAQIWSDKCEFKHGNAPFDGAELGLFEFGTTIWAWEGGFDSDQIAQNWADDKENFDPLKDSCIMNKPCGAYKQMVTAKTNVVGCGLTMCDTVAGLSNANFLVCYFAPPGSYHGERTYNAEGDACTMCSKGQFYCDNGLCDDTCTAEGANCECKAACKNCATQTSDCKCECNPGSIGPNCGYMCEDRDEKCGRRQHGWPKSMCTIAFPFVLELCPKMCGVCTEGDPCANSGGEEGTTGEEGDNTGGEEGPTGEEGDNTGEGNEESNGGEDEEAGGGDEGTEGGDEGATETGGEEEDAGTDEGTAPANDEGAEESDDGVATGGMETNAEGEEESDSGEVPSASGMTQSMRKRVLKIHNKYRKNEGASNMQKLKYNDKLESLAQKWADRCMYGHRTPDTFKAEDYGFSFVGENIWAWNAIDQPVPEAPMEAWFNEKNYYDFNSKHCSKEPCGHYTAIVWSSTREVGCGFTICPHLGGQDGKVNYNPGLFFVCNYGPGGNDGNQPYKKGTPCTECSTGKMFCTGTLCDDSCSSAGSGGKCECKANCNSGEQTPGCRCKCSGEYTGVACNEICADLSPKCGVSPGLPEMLCGDPNSSPFGPMLTKQANKECPKMCKKCGASKKRAEGVKDEILQAVDGILAEHDIHK